MRVRQGVIIAQFLQSHEELIQGRALLRLGHAGLPRGLPLQPGSGAGAQGEGEGGGREELGVRAVREGGGAQAGAPTAATGGAGREARGEPGHPRVRVQVVRGRTRDRVLAGVAAAAGPGAALRQPLDRQPRAGAASAVRVRGDAGDLRLQPGLHPAQEQTDALPAHQTAGRPPQARRPPRLRRTRPLPRLRLERLGRHDLRHRVGVARGPAGLLLPADLRGDRGRVDHDGVGVARVRGAAAAEHPVRGGGGAAARAAGQLPLRDLQPAEPVPAVHGELAVPVHGGGSPRHLAVHRAGAAGLLLLLQPPPPHQTPPDPEHLHGHGRHHRHTHHLHHQLHRHQRLRRLPHHRTQHTRTHQDRVPRQTRLICLPHTPLFIPTQCPQCPPMCPQCPQRPPMPPIRQYPCSTPSFLGGWGMPPQQLMNNPRGTYINKKPNTHMSSAHVDRTTYNSTSVSKQPAEKGSQGQQDRMIIKILEVVGKLENPTNTPAISRETLKTGSNKAFFDVLCILLRAMDGTTERGVFSSGGGTELLQEALRFLGYKGNYNRSIFQPIGAPHTWTPCLTILEWFSELAAFAANFQGVLQERLFEEDVSSLTLATFNSRNEELVANFVRKQLEHHEAQITTTSFSIESKQMAIRNQHAAQKDLTLVLRELEKERELVYRARQEEMALEAEVRGVELAIQGKQEELAVALEREAAGRAALEKLRYEIVHQELPPEECEKIKLEIRDTKNKVAEIEEGIAETVDIQRAVNKDYLEAFTDLASQARRLAERQAASPLLADADARPLLPALTPLELSDLLRGSLAEWVLDLEGEARLEGLFREREFQAFFRRQEELVGKFEARFGKEEEALLGKDQELQALEARARELQDALDQKDALKKALLARNALQLADKKDLDRALADLQAEIQVETQEIAQKTAQKDALKRELKEALEELRQLDETCRDTDRERNDILRRARERLEAEKRTCLEKIEAYKRSLAGIFGSRIQTRCDP